jgi:hypothetical protein
MVCQRARRCVHSNKHDFHVYRDYNLFAVGWIYNGGMVQRWVL